MLICQNCGKELVDAMDICPICGSQNLIQDNNGGEQINSGT